MTGTRIASAAARLTAAEYVDPVAVLRQWAAREPDAEIAVSYDVPASMAAGQLCGRTSFTAEALWQQVTAVAAALRARGIGAGDTVAIQLPNWPEYLLAHLAVLAAGAITVPISSILRAHDVAQQLRISRARAMIIPTKHGRTDYPAMIAALRSQLPDLATVVTVRGHAEATLDLGDVVREGSRAELAGERARIADGSFVPDPDAPAIVNFTSGSTGVPKGVMHSLRSASAHVAPVTRLMALRHDDVFLIPTTLGHAAGFLNGMYIPLSLQAKIVYLDRWDAGVAMQAIQADAISYAPAMPTYLADLLSHPRLHEHDLSSWRAARVSGGPINQSALTRMQAKQPQLGLFRGWGMTEALMLTGCGPDDPADKRLHTDGRPLGLCQLSIRGADLVEELPPGRTGEILVRGDSLMLGYFEQQELTEQAFTADGWLRSGDLGFVDTEGYLTISGRIKDIVVRGGENIPVKVVEDLLAEHPDILSVCVVGLPDERLGEKVCAVLRSRRDSLGLDEVRDYLVDRQLTRQFIPELLVLLDELPRSSVNKIQRDEVRRLAASALDIPLASN